MQPKTAFSFSPKDSFGHGENPYNCDVESLSLDHRVVTSHVRRNQTSGHVSTTHNSQVESKGVNRESSLRRFDDSSKKKTEKTVLKES